MGLLSSSSNTFDPATDIPSLAGKIYIVTGGSAGIGFGILSHLVQHRARTVFLLSNKREHAESAIAELQQHRNEARGDASVAAPAGETAAIRDEIVQWRQCNLESLRQTAEVATGLKQELTAKYGGQLDGLCCNAGLGVGKYAVTEDGLDSHFQVNHLSQMLLTLTLLPLLQATPHSRLVLQSSDLHRAANPSTAWASVEEINTDVGPSFLYNRTKLAQVQFLLALQRRATAGELGFRPQNASSPNDRALVYLNAVHPGGVNTDQPKQAVDAYGTAAKVGAALIKPLMKDPVDEGCRPALFALTSRDIVTEGITGQYIVPDRKVTEPSDRARDEGMQEQLWELSMKLLREKVPGMAGTAW